MFLHAAGNQLRNAFHPVRVSGNRMHDLLSTPNPCLECSQLTILNPSLDKWW